MEVIAQLQMSDGDFRDVFKALCFIEDSFRCLCFFESAKECQAWHVCSTEQEWRNLIQLANELHTDGSDWSSQKLESWLPKFMNLYNTFCTQGHYKAFSWVEEKLRAHVAFFQSVSAILQVYYHPITGFGVVSRGSAVIDEIADFEFQDPLPHILLPLRSLQLEEEFGSDHPIITRLWDFESSKSEAEVFVGICGLFNCVCPDCKTIDVFRHPAHDLISDSVRGYMRFRISPSSTLFKGKELAYPYWERWMDRSRFSCLICKRQPYNLVMQRDRMTLIDVLRFHIQQNSQSSHFFLFCLESCIFTLSKTIKQLVKEDADLNLLGTKAECMQLCYSGASSLMFWMLNCFPVDCAHVPSLISGSILHLISSSQPVKSSSNSTEYSQENGNPTFFFQYACEHFYKELMDLEMLFESRSFSQDVCDRLLNSIKNHQRESSQKLAGSASSWETFVLQKLLFVSTPRDSSDYVKVSLEDVLMLAFSESTSVDIFAANSQNHFVHLLKLLFILVSASPLRPCHLSSPLSFQQLMQVYRVKRDKVRLFSRHGMMASVSFPQKLLDITPHINSLLENSSVTHENVFSESALENFGGIICFLISKIKHCSLFKKLFDKFTESFISSRRLNASAQIFETFYCNLLQNSDVFALESTEEESDEKNIDSEEFYTNHLSDFIYWAISQDSSLAHDSWVKKLSSTSLDLEIAFGRFEADPLNLWTILVYLCCLISEDTVRIGTRVFNLFEFTSKYAIPKLKIILSDSESESSVDVHDVYFLTHVVYILTDYGTLRLTANHVNCFSDLLLLLTRRYSQLLRCPISREFAECLCELNHCMDVIQGWERIEASLNDELRIRRAFLGYWLRENLESIVRKCDLRYQSSQEPFHFVWCSLVAFGCFQQESKTELSCKIRIRLFELLNKALKN